MLTINVNCNSRPPYSTTNDIHKALSNHFNQTSPMPSPQPGAKPQYYYPNTPSYASPGAGKSGKPGDATIIEEKNWIKDMQAQADLIDGKNSKPMRDLTKAEVKEKLRLHDQEYIKRFMVPSQ